MTLGEPSATTVTALLVQIPNLTNQSNKVFESRILMIVTRSTKKKQQQHWRQSELTSFVNLDFEAIFVKIFGKINIKPVAVNIDLLRKSGQHKGDISCKVVVVAADTEGLKA